MSGLCKEFFEKADERASQSIIGGLFGTRFPLSVTVPSPMEAV